MHRCGLTLAAFGSCLAFLLAAGDLYAEPISRARATIAQQHDRWCEDEVAPCGKAQMLMKRMQAGLAVGEQVSPGEERMLLEASEDTDILHNDLDIEIFPATEVISGSNTMTIQSKVNGLTEFTFRLRSNFTISSVIENGTTTIPGSSVQSVGTYGRLVPLTQAYNLGDVFTLEVNYSGTAVSRGFGSIEFTGQYGGGSDIVYTLSEPYYAATWWPTKDGDFAEPGDNADKATLELAVTAPSSMHTISNGLLLGVDPVSGGKSKYRWASNYPIATYLTCFSSTNYNTWTQNYDYGGGTMPVEFNIYPGSDTPANRAAWEQCLVMLDTFGTIYGPYPFINEKYGIYQCEFGGGMEHQTNTAQGGFGEMLTAHELSHQWWGDNVTCKTWGDIWLNEGFATYSEALWLERKPGSSGLPALFSAMANRRPSSVGDSVYCYDTSDLYRIFSTDYSYLKGGWVLHQLRHVVGDDAFFDILAAYRAAYEGSGATTDDFAAVCSTVHGQDLSWFFQEWVYDIGAPAYQWGWQTANIGGQDYLRLFIDQVQSSSYPRFIMPVDIRVNYPGGNQTYTVWNDEDREHFVIPIAGPATSVVFDEFDWILHTSDSQVSYQNGPPVVVQTNPQPGDALQTGPSQLTITFSENVSISAGDVSVVGDSTGPASFSFSYSAGTYAATLDFGGPLPGDDYTVTVADTVVSSAAGISLDGEMADPNNPASLPSGEGLPGGNAVFDFSVAAHCPGDLNGDGFRNVSDFTLFAAAFGSQLGDPDYNPDADLDGNGIVNVTDFTQFAGVYGVPCP
jgi:aminopeptidase N